MSTRKPEWWAEALQFLNHDIDIGPLIEQFGPYGISSKDTLFETLIRSIVGQQISVAASDSIWNRLIELIGEVTPISILNHSFDQLKACGLTKSKTEYIIDLSNQHERLVSADYDGMTDQALSLFLQQFRGIGPWTAEMVLMFHFLRPDIFSGGDVGLVNAVQSLHPHLTTRQSVEAYAQRWSPFRTAACWYLWRTIDAETVEY